MLLAQCIQLAVAGLLELAVALALFRQLQLQRLKKRKLMVKDQIALLERQLTPDIPA